MPGSGAFALIDLEHMGRPESVAACLLESPSGPLLIDPGPSSTLARLEAGLAERGYGLRDLSALLLTHIHLDHAGATGTLARTFPALRVFVHSAGAPHLVDPAKLVRSATRLYGERMDSLWGEIAPVAAERITVLSGGERLRFGGRELEVAFTPGHASHHVSYFDSATRVAFVGDTAGLYGPRFPVVLPVTPPPDFELEAWLESLNRIERWRPDQLVLTHYGPAADPVAHLSELRAGLAAWAGFARESLDHAGTDADRIGRFIGRLETWMVGRAPPEDAARFLAGAGPEACWHGLARYWRKQA